MKTKPNEPANFSLEYNEGGYGNCLTLNLGGERQYIPFQTGLTKREHFAALAMQSMAINWNNNDEIIKECARRSVQMADALINALNESQ